MSFSQTDRSLSNANLKRPASLCNPVSKDGQGVHDPTAHLVCYRTAPQSGFQRRDIGVRNQFGDQTVTVLKPLQLCVPSEKDGVPSALGIDHFRCYKARIRPGTPSFDEREVTLVDQFENKRERVTGCFRFCTPVDKNGEGIPDPAAHLTCYRLTDVSGQPPSPRRDVTVHNQFGDAGLRVRSIAQLCAPSLEIPIPTTTTSSTTTSTSTSSTSSTTTTSTSSTTSTT